MYLMHKQFNGDTYFTCKISDKIEMQRGTSTFRKYGIQHSLEICNKSIQKNYKKLFRSNPTK